MHFLSWDGYWYSNHMHLRIDIGEDSHSQQKTLCVQIFKIKCEILPLFNVLVHSYLDKNVLETWTDTCLLRIGALTWRVDPYTDLDTDLNFLNCSIFSSIQWCCLKKKRTWVDMVICVLSSSGLPKQWWGKAVLASYFILNGVPFKRSDKMTPSEL